jgi:uncharacterized protein (TIGR02246 family)
MGRISGFVAMAFLAGLGTGLIVRSSVAAAPQQQDTHTADLAAIEKLHQADEECTLAQDPKCLTTLWSDDGINLGFPGPPAVGMKAIGEAYAKFRAQYPEFQVLKYAPDYKEMQTAIVGEWAIEVGGTAATYKMSANATPVTTPSTKGMRLLKRQSDGSWKFALCCMK